MILERRAQHCVRHRNIRKYDPKISWAQKWGPMQRRAAWLIAKEFLYHDYCYNILTKPVYKGKECNDNNYDDSESSFTATENFIQVTFWKIIKLFPWGHWQVYTTWSKEMIADTATSWKWSWKIGIDFFHFLIDNTDFLVHKIR